MSRVSGPDTGAGVSVGVWDKGLWVGVNVAAVVTVNVAVVTTELVEVGAACVCVLVEVNEGERLEVIVIV
jgi:hypothetical protein